MRTQNALSRLPTLMTAALLLTTIAGTAAAQSTDRDRPTRLASNEIKGSAVDDTVEYYYTFAAGPGEITVTLDAKAGPK
ncbi:MAG TPA: hypothetical protein VM866_08225, partial [Pyrinomonadaceae bacterium]|nr:hypothetical protein [Pyrinomonadaceae bacterium]